MAFAFALLTLGTGVGCAGGSLGRIGDQELPVELPKDFQEKFEVRDTGAAISDSKPAFQPTELINTGPSPAPKKSSRKASRKKGKHEQPAAPAAFIWPNRRPPKEPIWVGEKAVYEITYFGMSAGDFTFEVLPHKVINNRKVYHIRGKAESSAVFSLFYRLNDTVETFIDYEGIFTHRFHLLLDESKQTRDSLELYDSEKGQTYYWNRWNRKDAGYTESKNFYPMIPFSQDSMSALYYLRTVPLPDGAVIKFPVINEGKFWDAIITVIRREKVRTPMGLINAIVLKPEAQYQGVLKKQGDSFMWVSDDDRRLLLRLEAKVKIGTVVGTLKKFEKGEPPQ